LARRHALEGLSELLAALGGDPAIALGVIIEVPGVALGGHPDLARGAVAVHDVFHAVRKLQREDAARELDLEPAELAQRALEGVQRLVGGALEVLLGEGGDAHECGLAEVSASANPGSRRLLLGRVDGSVVARSWPRASRSASTISRSSARKGSST